MINECGYAGQRDDLCPGVQEGTAKDFIASQSGTQFKIYTFLLNFPFNISRQVTKTVEGNFMHKGKLLDSSYLWKKIAFVLLTILEINKSP